MLLTEITASFNLFTGNPYGSGWTKEPVEVGEIIVGNDGNEYEFVSLSADGKKINAIRNGKKVQLDVDGESFLALHAGKTP